MSLHTMTMLLFDVLNQPHTLMPLILLLIVLGTNIYTGPLTLFKSQKWYPLNILESLIVWCDQKLNRENRSPSDRLIRGGLTSIIIFLNFFDETKKTIEQFNLDKLFISSFKFLTFSGKKP